MSLAVLTIVPSGLAIAGNLYTIHCSSYKTQKQAEADAKNLNSQGYKAFVARTEIEGKGIWYRVNVGKYATKEKATSAAEELVKKNVLGRYSILPVSSDKTDKKKENNARQKESLKNNAKFPEVIKEKNTEKSKTGSDKKEKTVQSKAADKVFPAPLHLIAGKKSQKIEKAPEEKYEAHTGSVLYEKALTEMRNKKYEDALITFKEFVARNDTSKELGQRALRHMADCHYFLGEIGSQEHLRIAVEFYKNTLMSFPDHNKENALTYFRLARTYENLKNNSEAFKNYERLLALYPESAYASEASFRIGELLYRTGKHNQAADKFIAYLLKSKGGSFAKQAFYLTADCYYRMQQSASAEVWFRDAQKKWPDLNGVPKEVILDLGQHKFSLRRYDEAIKIFSFYVNLYPTDEKLKDALLLLANSYKAVDQVSAALTLYNMIIDKYAQSKEADESVLGIASIGVDKPGVKVFSALNHIQYYKQPLQAYDHLLMKNPTGELAEKILLEKANALHKLKQDIKAIDAYSEFLKKYPQSKMAGEAKRSIKSASADMIDNSYKDHDHIAVADFYFKAYRAMPLGEDEYDTVNKIAYSLGKIGLQDDRVKLLADYRRICKDDKIAVKIMFNIAEGEMARNQFGDAEKIYNELLGRSSLKKTPLMALIRKNLAEIAYYKKSYDKAAAEFDAVVKSGQAVHDPGSTYWRYAASLKGKKDDSVALQNYLMAVKYLDQDNKALTGAGELYQETGDMYFKANNFKNGIAMYNKVLAGSSGQDLKYWAMFKMGQSYLRMDNHAEAQKKFNQIKTQAGPEGFWTRVVDYHVSDREWWNKYGEFLKR